MGACPSGKESKTIGPTIYCIVSPISARKSNCVMVMVTIHIAYVTCLVTNDAGHAYGVIGVYKLHLRTDGISYFAKPAILWLAGTLMGEVGAIIGVWAACRLANRPIPVGQKNIVLINQ